MIKHIIFISAAAVLLFLAVPLSWATVSLFNHISVKSPVEMAFFAGFAAYLFVHMLLYKPVFIHVMAHELTHALFAFAFGGKTKKLEVSDRGGRVMINKSNFIISLAPYFIPLYTLVFMLIFVISKEQYQPYIAFFVGAGLAFHIALTIFSMSTSQSDLYEDSNILFSVVFVYVMNLVIIAFVLSVIIPEITMKSYFRDFADKTLIIVKKIIELVKQ